MVQPDSFSAPLDTINEVKLSNNFAMPFSLKLTTTKNCTRHKILKEMTHRKINEMGAKKKQKTNTLLPVSTTGP